MKSHLNEDDILVLLNDININENELSDLELNDKDINQITTEVLNRIKNKKPRRKKWIIAASIGTILVVLFLGRPVIAAISSKIFENNKDIKKAVENNYVQKLDEKAAYDNGVKIELTDVILDKRKLALSFKIKFEDKKLINNIKLINLDLKIEDENGKIIYGKISSQEDANKQAIQGGKITNWNYEVLNDDEGTLRYDFVLNSIDVDIPTLNKMNICIEKILYADHLNVKSEEDVDKMDGLWNIDVDLDSKFKEENKIVFRYENINDEVKIISAESNPTGSVIKFTTPPNTDIIREEGISLVANNGSINNADFIFRNTDYIKGISTYTVEFNISTFDDLNDLVFIVKNYNGEDIKIKLIK